MKTEDGITYYETLEELGVALYKMGLIVFVDGQYKISEKGLKKYRESMETSPPPTL
jgi:hypothetical protein